jgi:hypothetical protein
MPTYQIKNGKTKEILRNFTGSWSDCRESLIKGEYPKRVKQQHQPKRPNSAKTLKPRGTNLTPSTSIAEFRERFGKEPAIRERITEVSGWTYAEQKIYIELLKNSMEDPASKGI